jgi:hypothetical protein
VEPHYQRIRKQLYSMEGKISFPQLSLAIENRKRHDSFIKDKMDHNIEESKPHEDTSELKISSDVSAHMHEEKTCLRENTADSRIS